MLDPRRHRPTTWEATNSASDVDDSGICSPPMWTTSPPRGQNGHRSLSPTSRTQAIVRGQRELMEMVKNMPEANYELSLKDLVEHHHRVDARHENALLEERNFKREKIAAAATASASGRKVQVKRNGNIDRGGFYLKMVLPFSFGYKDKKKIRNKKNESSGNSSSRVTPKPSVSDGTAKGGVDKEWWKKSHAACRESDSGESSINSESLKSSGSSSSNSSSRSNSRRENGGRRCWSFIRRPKIRTQK